MMASFFKMRNSGLRGRRSGNQTREMRLMRVMTLIAFKLHLGATAFIPVTVDSAMRASVPVSVCYTMTFSAQQNRLIIRDFAAIKVNICLQVFKIMAVIAAKI